jgi:alpha-N-arabinofuranosidase
MGLCYPRALECKEQKAGVQYPIVWGITLNRRELRLLVGDGDHLSFNFGRWRVCFSQAGSNYPRHNLMDAYIPLTQAGINSDLLQIKMIETAELYVKHDACRTYNKYRADDPVIIRKCAMEITHIHFDPENIIGDVDPRIFGGFLEHLGRAVYQGVFDPESEQADTDGYRRDVLLALKKLGLTTMRYPGGNFASGYHWQDGIGPTDKRPVVRDLAWQSLEPNTFGTDEYIRLCRKMAWLPMLTVNLGTGTPEEARNWVEYCNSPPGSRYADHRAQYASQLPYSVKLWCLGNEMDGDWQLGHVPAREYAIRAQQAATMMKDVDPSIEVVVCGSSGPSMPTFMNWDRQVLECMGDLANFISLHRYVGNPQDDTPDFLAVSNTIDRQIEQIDTVCKSVQAQRHSSRRTFLCFDEWNVWYRNMEMNGAWQTSPHLLEEVYNLEDALVVAGFLQSFIRHADVVKIANLAQIVNVIAPIQTRGAELLIQSIYYPFEMISRRKHGISLHPFIKGPRYEGRENGDATYIDCSAISDGSTFHLFVTNRNIDESAIVVADINSRKMALEDADILTGTSPKVFNSYDSPARIKPRRYRQVEVIDGKAHMILPPHSFIALTFTLE